MQYFNIAISHYGWEGIAMLSLMLLLFSIQFFYYTFRFGRLGRYLNKHRAALHEVPPPVSLVIPMYSEDCDYLDTTLPQILTQEGVTFDVVIVYVGSDNDFFDDLLRIKGIFSNFSATKIARNERFPISVKTALNVGIKAAKYEHIIFSTTDSRPASTKWLALMAKGFQRGDVVLGYCGIEIKEDKSSDYFVRVSRLEESMKWLSSAIAGKPYRAIRSNMGFTRSLYFSVNGFNRLNMNIGEDDLFMQSIMTRDNTSVILSPRAAVIQSSWGGISGLVDTKRYYDSAIPFYPISARNYISWELTSRVLLFLTWLIGVIFLPLELKLFFIFLALMRVIFVLRAVKRVAERVGEKRVVGRYLMYDFLSPLFAAYMRLKMVRRDSRVWR